VGWNWHQVGRWVRLWWGRAGDATARLPNHAHHINVARNRERESPDGGGVGVAGWWAVVGVGGWVVC